MKAFLCPLSRWHQQLRSAPVFRDGLQFSQASGELVVRWLGTQSLGLVSSRSLVASVSLVAWG